MLFSWGSVLLSALGRGWKTVKEGLKYLTNIWRIEPDAFFDETVEDR